MKLQALFPSKTKSKKIKVSSAAILVWRFLRELNLRTREWCRNT